MKHDQIVAIMIAALKESESMGLSAEERGRYLANRLWVRVTLSYPRRWPWFLLGMISALLIAWGHC